MEIRKPTICFPFGREFDESDGINARLSSLSVAAGLVVKVYLQSIMRSIARTLQQIGLLL